MIVAGTRTGGTFLSLCLDSHPAIACWITEPLHPLSTFVDVVGSDKAYQIAWILWNRGGYQATGFKVTYGQQLDDLIVASGHELSHVTALHLMRCTVDTEISRAIDEKRHSDPTYDAHTFHSVTLKAIEIDPIRFASQCYANIRERASVTARLQTTFASVVDIWYKNMVPGYCENTPAYRGYMIPSTGKRICDALGVDYYDMTSLTRRVNSCYTRHELVSNWDVVLRELRRQNIPEDYHAEINHLAGTFPG